MYNIVPSSRVKEKWQQKKFNKRERPKKIDFDETKQLVDGQVLG